MTTIKNFIQTFFQSKFRTNLFILLVVAIFIAIINLLAGSTKTPSPTSTEPIISPVTNQPSTSSPLPTPKLSVNWKISESPSVPEKLYEYPLTTALVSTKTLESLPSKLNFNNSQKSVVKDKNVGIWTNKSNSIIVSIKDNSIQYSTNSAPKQSGSIFVKESCQKSARQIIKNLFGESIETSLIDQNVDYYKSFNIYSSPSSQETADLARVSFYQSIDQYPVLSQSETGAIFTLYLDRSLNLYSLSVKGGFEITSKGNELTIYPFSEVKKIANTAQRLNASPDLATNFQTASSKKIDLSVQKAKIGYMEINGSFLPIYVLEGDLGSTNTASQPGIFALPASKVN